MASPSSKENERPKRILVGDRELTATWTDDAPETAKAISAELPLAGDAARWGEELYFDVPVDVPAENALCLFWGPTPASADEEPRAAGPVSVVAQIDDVSPLRSLTGGSKVAIERA